MDETVKEYEQRKQQLANASDETGLENVIRQAMAEGMTLREIEEILDLRDNRPL